MGIFLSNPKFYNSKAGKILKWIFATALLLRIGYEIFLYFKN